MAIDGLDERGRNSERESFSATRGAEHGCEMDGVVSRRWQGEERAWLRCRRRVQCRTRTSFRCSAGIFQLTGRYVVIVFGCWLGGDEINLSEISHKESKTSATPAHVPLMQEPGQVNQTRSYTQPRDMWTSCCSFVDMILSSSRPWTVDVCASLLRRIDALENSGLVEGPTVSFTVRWYTGADADSRRIILDGKQWDKMRKFSSSIELIQPKTTWCLVRHWNSFCWCSSLFNLNKVNRFSSQMQGTALNYNTSKPIKLSS